MRLAAIPRLTIPRRGTERTVAFHRRAKVISREKASRGFCALSVVRESGVAFFFYFLLFFFFFGFGWLEGKGFNRDCRWRVGRIREREREKKENWNRSAFLFVREKWNDSGLLPVYFEVVGRRSFSCIRKGVILTLISIVIGFGTLEPWELLNGNNRSRFITRVTFFTRVFDIISLNKKGYKSLFTSISINDILSIYQNYIDKLWITCR